MKNPLRKILLKIKVEAITLGSFPFGESHKVIVLMTKNNGILKGVAHGVRKPTSKFASSMEMFNTVELLLQSSKNSDLYSIREHSVITGRHEIRQNPNLMGYFFYLSEFLNEFYKIASHDKNVFNLVNEYLDAFGSGNNLYSLFRALTVKLIFESGFVGEPYYCSECTKQVSSIKLSPRAGYFFCENCANDVYAETITTGSVKLLIKLNNSSIEEIKRIKINQIQKKELDNIVNTIVKGIFGKKLKSEQYIYLNAK